MTTCPKCHSQLCIKDGVINEKQRFKCKSCGYRHTVLHRGLSLEIRRQALQLYLAGLGFRSIGRLLQCSHVTVSQWIREHGDSVKSIRADKVVNVVKTKDLHAYVNQKSHSPQATTLVIDVQTDCTALCIPLVTKQSKVDSRI
ncbi:MAG: helix-turn-helix domain-containing protein [Methylococcaceae bacterium]